MHAEYRNLRTRETTDAESEADRWLHARQPVEYREVDAADWQPLTGWRRYARPASALRRLFATCPRKRPDPVVDIGRDTVCLPARATGAGTVAFHDLSTLMAVFR